MAKKMSKIINKPGAVGQRLTSPAPVATGTQLARLSESKWKKNGDFELVILFNDLDFNFPEEGQVSGLDDQPILPAEQKVMPGDLIHVELVDANGAGLGYGDTPSAPQDARILRADLPEFDDLPSGTYTVRLTLTGARTLDDAVFSGSDFVGLLNGNSALFTITFPDFPITLPEQIGTSVDNPLPVALQPTHFDDKPDETLWDQIIKAKLPFSELKSFIDVVLCFHDGDTSNSIVSEELRTRFKNRLPFLNVDEYSLIKFATEALMRNRLYINGADGYFGTNVNGSASYTYLPYYEHLSESLEEILDDYDAKDETGALVTGGDCLDRENERLQQIPAIELIWSYWMEQAMLVQSMNIVNLRFQNMKGLREIEPLMRFDTSPLRPLSNILWGFIQDEQHRTTLHRRVFEYQHAYNLTLEGRAVPRLQGVDDRSNFLEAFHNLLHYASIFYKDYDDTTRRADAFPLLTALREVHLLLAEGNHNAYFNMTWTTRAEMLSMQYILARQEMRLFLGGRPMVPYPELWMDRVDTMKSLQGWDTTSVIHYFDLATSGEKLLLGIRYGDWTDTAFSADDAGNWAVAFRDFAMRYVNAYRVVTGVDLSVDAVRIQPQERSSQPSALIQRRLTQNGNGKQETQTIELSQQRRALARR